MYHTIPFWFFDTTWLSPDIGSQLGVLPQTMFPFTGIDCGSGVEAAVAVAQAVVAAVLGKYRYLV